MHDRFVSGWWHLRWGWDAMLWCWHSSTPSRPHSTSVRAGWECPLFLHGCLAPLTFSGCKNPSSAFPLKGEQELLPFRGLREVASLGRGNPFETMIKGSANPIDFLDFKNQASEKNTASQRNLSWFLTKARLCKVFIKKCKFYPQAYLSGMHTHVRVCS